MRASSHRWAGKKQPSCLRRRPLWTVTGVTHPPTHPRQGGREERHGLTLQVGLGWGGAAVGKVLQDGGVPGEAEQHLGKDGPASGEGEGLEVRGESGGWG